VGKHVYDVPPQNYAAIGLLGNFTGTTSILAAVWSKTSFAVTLLRLMKGKMLVVVWVIIITMNIAMDLNAIFLWVRCSPVALTWDPRGPGTCWAPQVYPTYGMFAAGRCISTCLSSSTDRYAAGYSALMDFVLALLPWKIVWNLQMRKVEKLGVAFAMSLGVA
jgi:hypothetical protein